MLPYASQMDRVSLELIGRRLRPVAGRPRAWA